VSKYLRWKSGDWKTSSELKSKLLQTKKTLRKRQYDDDFGNTVFKVPTFEFQSEPFAQQQQLL
jgi:hypothetical protein